MNVALLVIAAVLSAAAANEPPPIRIAYFVPSDRQPIDGYVERLDRVMTEVQQFYRNGMDAAGYGAKTFRLDRDPHGRLRVEMVRGGHPMRTYGQGRLGVDLQGRVPQRLDWLGTAAARSDTADVRRGCPADRIA